MFVDLATLQDLEILATPTVRGTTLWSLVNRTRTRVGGDALRDRFLNPPHTADEILALQRAHHVLAASANDYRRTPVGTVFSSVQIIDNLIAGESFYLAEVRRIGALATALADHGSAVAVVDEPFRGTNVHDAAEATLAVITRLAAHPGVLAFVASHVGEVAPGILGDRRIAFRSFAADVTGEQPRFDFRLREGISHQRLDMTLLRQEGILDSLERSIQGTANHA